ncbi:endonuclease/Exonuclease/phosphatase family protein [Formosa agariphila KMM 3901]|uniref:Endonuclease/Exonuclease/phosphatase family protein n=1 Tax=Formosa agariphila (strain DSM 15362 / KCTC 12365 / LMG 23005 / KMM 3901 / M-2Alg 35-1) TaxID=1347342 RepID=T2KRC3_FORAG|nr:endonuclease [Formosa agariphila]CDF81006.1 endonuclease/Exonuclease/phosphatase family protein [Formosa agariphila KMM 3901]
MKTIAFFNLENLFDITNDPNTFDTDFLSTSEKRWTLKRYENKLFKLGLAISSIGKTETETHPAIVGVAEVENAKVIQDLLDSEHLKDIPYDFVHYDSPDERGIDVALLYDTTQFTVTDSAPYSIILTEENGETDYTRDILRVSGIFNGEVIHLLVNHWPSKHEESNEPKRMEVSNKATEIITSLKLEDPNAKIIVMGDFNDNSSSESVQALVNNNALFNPMEQLKSFDRGTVNYRFKWDVFDQFMLTHNFLDHRPGTHNFDSANIFDPDFMKQYKGRFKGQPFRTYAGKTYKGGYSDHFPVYLLLRSVPKVV